MLAELSRISGQLKGATVLVSQDVVPVRTTKTSPEQLFHSLCWMLLFGLNPSDWGQFGSADSVRQPITCRPAKMERNSRCRISIHSRRYMFPLAAQYSICRILGSDFPL